jgi:hypothetical protein
MIAGGVLGVEWLAYRWRIVLYVAREALDRRYLGVIGLSYIKIDLRHNIMTERSYQLCILDDLATQCDMVLDGSLYDLLQG